MLAKINFSLGFFSHLSVKVRCVVEAVVGLPRLKVELDGLAGGEAAEEGHPVGRPDFILPYLSIIGKAL